MRKTKQKLIDAINKAFFILEFNPADWLKKNEEEKIDFITDITDIRSGIGLPIALRQAQGDPNGVMVSLSNRYGSV
jgi:hypothetical protein